MGILGNLNIVLICLRTIDAVIRRPIAWKILTIDNQELVREFDSRLAF